MDRFLVEPLTADDVEATCRKLLYSADQVWQSRDIFGIYRGRGLVGSNPIPERRKK